MTRCRSIWIFQIWRMSWDQVWSATNRPCRQTRTKIRWEVSTAELETFTMSSVSSTWARPLVLKIWTIRWIKIEFILYLPSQRQFLRKTSRKLNSIPWSKGAWLNSNLALSPSRKLQTRAIWRCCSQTLEDWCASAHTRSLLPTEPHCRDKRKAIT